MPALNKNGVATVDQLDACPDDLLLSDRVGMSRSQVAKLREALARTAARRKATASGGAEAAPATSAALGETSQRPSNAAEAHDAAQPAQMRDGVLSGPLEVKEGGLFVDKWTPALCSFDVSTKVFRAAPLSGGAPLVEKKVSKV